jgi:predicted metal-dependent HD superfamily phosphohydrolase
MDYPFLEKRWLTLLGRWGIPAEKAARAFKLVKRHYDEGHRSYHALGFHIEPLMREFDAVKSQAKNPDAVEYALFMHDVIYDVVPRTKNNEWRSAEYATDLLTCLGIKNEHFSAAVQDAILATRHDGANQYHYDSLLTADIDLSGFSGDLDRALESTRRIRFEYSEVPYELFVAEHGRILRGLLDRPMLYHTAIFNSRCGRAKKNIAAIINQLPDLARHPLGPNELP